MRRRRVKTFDAVVDVLGGIKAIAALTAVTPAAVCHWRSRSGRFPARTHERIQAELSRRSVSASRELWDFDPPRSYDDPDKRLAKAD
jgi:hypothetical protein